MIPAAMPLWTVRMMYPKMFMRMCEIIQILGAGGLVAVPSYAELAGPAAADVDDLFPGGERRRRDAHQAVPPCLRCRGLVLSGRQQLYERYYSGDPVRLAATLYGLYEKDTHIDRIFAMLDDLAERQQRDGPPPAFHRPA